MMHQGIRVANNSKTLLYNAPLPNREHKELVVLVKIDRYYLKLNRRQMLQVQEHIEQSITIGSAIQTNHHLAILLYPIKTTHGSHGLFYEL
jgi:hypothetical protein